jgi:hypothetical protein
VSHGVKLSQLRINVCSEQFFIVVVISSLTSVVLRTVTCRVGVGICSSDTILLFELTSQLGNLLSVLFGALMILKSSSEKRGYRTRWVCVRVIECMRWRADA